jgi:molybdenum cofactor cytidylyltransferase
MIVADNTTRTEPTSGIILAAGESSRWGKPKQLLDLNGRLLVEWVLDAALSSNLDRVALVLGRDHQKICTLLADKAGHPKLEIIFNPRFQEGQGSSLTTGLRRVCDHFPMVMFLLGDQPLVSAAVINLLLEKFTGSNKAICVPSHAGKRGNPTLFRTPFYPDLFKIAGDKGARDIIAAHPQEVLEVEIDDASVFLDIDTREDFEKMTRLLESRRGF